MRNIAVILAGGVGSRMGYATPKQFYKVAGKTVIEHTVDAFEKNRHIDEIAIVMNPSCIGQMEDILFRNTGKKDCSTIFPYGSGKTAGSVPERSFFPVLRSETTASSAPEAS